MSAGSALQERIVLLFNIRGAVSAVCSIIDATFSVSNRTDCAPGNKSQVKMHLSRCCCCINWHRERQLFNCLVKKMTLSPKGSGDTTDMHSFQFVVGFFCLAHFLADAIEKQNMILICNYMGIMHVFWQWICENEFWYEAEWISVWAALGVIRLLRRYLQGAAEVQVSPLH